MTTEIFSLVGRIRLDGQAEVESELKKTKLSMEKVRQGLKVAGAAFTAAGAAGLKLVADARKLNAQLGVTASGLGVTTGELRNLALEAANVTFSVEDVAKTFDLLTRAGVKTAEEVKATAIHFDTLADAVGKTAPQVAEVMIPALRAFGIEVTDAGKYIDTFTWLSRKTTIGLDEFGRMMTYLAPEIRTLGLSINDTVAIMAALEVRGITGAAATRQLRFAVREAAREGKPLIEVLGLTTEEVARYTVKIEGATGMSEKYATISAEQFGIVDKLRHEFRELTLQVGSYLQPLEGVMAGMTALGPIMMAASTDIGIKTIKTIAATTKMIAYKISILATNAALIAFKAAAVVFKAGAALVKAGLILAMGPFAPIGLAIAGLVAAGVYLWRNWDEVSAKAQQIWGTIADFFVDLWQRVVGIFRDHWEKIVTILFPTIGIPLLIRKHWEPITNFFQELWNRITDAMTAAWQAMLMFFTDISQQITDRITATWDGIKQFLSMLNPWEWIKTGWEAFRDGIANILRAIFGGSIITDWAAGIKGFLSALNPWGWMARGWEAVKSGITAVWEGIVNIISSKVATIMGFLGSVWERARGLVDFAREQAARAGALISGAVAGAQAAVAGAVATAQAAVAGIAERAREMTAGVLGVTGKAARAVAETVGGQIPRFQHGGVVPGPRGMPTPIIAHGGEMVIPERLAGSLIPGVVITGNNFYVRQESDIDMIADKLIGKIRLKSGVKI